MAEFPDREWIAQAVSEHAGAHAAVKPEWSNALVLWIGPKMFGIQMRHPDGTQLLTLKLPPDQGLWLRGAYEFARPGYHLNKRHWTSFDLHNASLDAEFTRELIAQSYDCLLESLPRWRQHEIVTGVPRG